MSTSTESSIRTAMQSPHIPAPRFRYSPCVRIGFNYQVSGMVALDPASGKLETGGPGAETTRILSNLQLALPDYGLSLDELLIARIYTTRMDAFSEINAAWETIFNDGLVPPARTSVGVSALPLGASVEIEFSFVKSSVSV
ncbi:RidA family protein [Undibacterium terreum]|uniref:Reactive intermediate/imine deaminase n=1 Tax=Undibacterium terreum TaxID=1224302 RepID=A0A916XLV3_9BURK|nr:RidA family protein [Undibacterium terreum]GGC85217.1 reactive intermediate/imine deaminase [Undibacterium terreum]